MKIYIVTRGKSEYGFSDYHIDAVFTNKTDAELYCAIYNCDNIEEYETYEHHFKTETKPKFLWVGRWGVRGDIVGKINFYDIKRTYVLNDIDEIEVDENLIKVKITTDTTVSLDEGNEMVTARFYDWLYEEIETRVKNV